DRQITEPHHSSGRAFDAMWITDSPPQHLISATNTQYLAAVTQMAGDGLLPAIGPQPSQVVPHIFATGENDQVRTNISAGIRRELQVHTRMQTQRIKIRVIADARQYWHHDFECAATLNLLSR